MRQASRERRERASNEMRQNILDAAEHLLIEGGPDHVTLRKIAAALDYAPPSLYYYYDDKDAVLDALGVRHAAQMILSLESHANKVSTDSRSFLVSLCNEYVAWSLEHPMFYLSLFRYRNRSEPSEGVRQLFFLVREPIAVLLRGSDEREINGATQSVISGMHGLLSILITQPGLISGPPHQAISDYLDKLMLMLQCDSNAPSAVR